MIGSFSQMIAVFWFSKQQRERSHGVMVKELECALDLSEFEIQSGFYVHFSTNPIGKCMNPLIP